MSLLVDIVCVCNYQWFNVLRVKLHEMTIFFVCWLYLNNEAITIEQPSNYTKKIHQLIINN